MPMLDIHTQVGHLVAEKPERSRVFERHGLDYCCGGKRSLEDACRDKSLDPSTVLAELEALDAEPGADEISPADMSMTELVDHIVETHHRYLRGELPRLEGLIDKVTAVHARAYPWLEEVRQTFADLVGELEPHMAKEEQVLFPMIRELDRAIDAPSFHCGSVSNPIRVMEHEHDAAGFALNRLRELTSDFTPSEGACNSFRAMLDGLAALETDLHLHIHKENNVLFVRAVEAEERLNAAG